MSGPVRGAMKIAMLCVLGVGLSGCAAMASMMHPRVGELAPQPNVFLAPSAVSLALAFGPDVTETVDVSDAQAPNGLARSFTLHLDRWRESLSNGFHAGFDRFFSKESNAQASTFELLEASPAIIVGAHSMLTIRYRAQVHDASGAVTQRFAGTMAMAAVGHSVADGVRMGVELMYEQIAQQMNK